MNISKKIFDHSQVLLIISIFMLIIFSPYYWETELADNFNFILFSLILLSAILTLKKSTSELKVIKTAGYLIIILTLITEVLDYNWLEIFSKIILVLFFLLVAINLLLGIIKSREVDLDVIMSAVAVYLLFGLCGALVMAVLVFFEPNSYQMSSAYPNQLHQYLYFSFVTITTTGYGDIIPIKPHARTLSIFLAIFGQLYLTVIIGILIGKYLSSKKV